MKPAYKCIYNHEMLINFTTQTPYQSYDEPVKKGQFIGYIDELKDTQVDAVMCCPLAWRLPTYHSKVNDVWQTWGTEWKAPLPEADWKYFDKVFERVRRYMLSENYEDPGAAHHRRRAQNRARYFHLVSHERQSLHPLQRRA